MILDPRAMARETRRQPEVNAPILPLEGAAFPEGIAADSEKWRRRTSGSHTQRNTAFNRAVYLLAELRCASLHARLLQADVDAVGSTLRVGLVTADQALDLLRDCDALHLVGVREGTV